MQMIHPRADCFGGAHAPLHHQRELPRIEAVRVDTGICAKGDFCAGVDRRLKTLALSLANDLFLLQRFRKDAGGFAFTQDEVRNIDIH